MRWRAARVRFALVSVEVQSGVPTSGSSVSKSCVQDAFKMQSDAIRAARRMHAGCNQTRNHMNSTSGSGVSKSCVPVVTSIGGNQRH